MKNLPFIVLIFLILSNLLFSREGTIRWTETYELQGEQMFRVSIEKGWEKEGWMPVVLSFGGLEMSLIMNTGSPAAAEDGVNSMISNILVGDTGLFLTIYEQNPVRTRMRLSDKNPVILKIDREKGQAEFHIGNKRLKLGSFRVSFRVIAPVEQGLYELTFERPGANANVNVNANADTGISTYKRFIYRSAAGTIYAVPGFRIISESDLTNSRAWAVGIDPAVIKKGGRR